MSNLDRNSKRPDAIGIDVGGVIIQRTTVDDDTSFFGDDFLATPAMPGAFEGIARLVAERFGERVFIVSKCGDAVQQRTRQWFAHHDFFARTGLDPANAHFCLTRRDKAPIARRLGLTHFVDDHADVLGHLYDAGIGGLFLLTTDADEITQGREIPGTAIVPDWGAIVAALLPDSSAPPPSATQP